MADAVPPPPFLLAVGDPLLALVPTRPIGIEETDELTLYVGGAEINTAIGVRRLGVPSGWLGRIGDDPLGRRIVSTFEREGVDSSLVVVDPEAPTGIYLREWLPDGLRRPYYYRHASAGAQLSTADWPRPWPEGLPHPTVLHVTGITSALSETAEEALHDMIGEAGELGCLISVDPNHRTALWPDRDRARNALSELARRADLLLLSEEDALVLFGSVNPATVLDGASVLGVDDVVFKRGAHGAIVRYRGTVLEIAPQPAARTVDPVGAGDGFNAGFLAATMLGLGPDAAGRCGAWCGARAVERLGDNTGYPLRTELPPDLRAAFDISDRQLTDR